MHESHHARDSEGLAIRTVARRWDLAHVPRMFESQALGWGPSSSTKSQLAANAAIQSSAAVTAVQCSFFPILVPHPQQRRSPQFRDEPQG